MFMDLSLPRPWPWPGGNPQDLTTCSSFDGCDCSVAAYLSVGEVKKAVTFVRLRGIEQLRLRRIHKVSEAGHCHNRALSSIIYAYVIICNHAYVYMLYAHILSLGPPWVLLNKFRIKQLRLYILSIKLLKTMLNHYSDTWGPWLNLSPHLNTCA